MTVNDPVIGRQLANFQVERSIGRGGMAQVYYGQDVKLRRPVAIKVIDARYRDKPAYAERFVREAQTIATWRHENIIQIYYADDEDGLYYFVMEYIDGADLAKVLSQFRQTEQLMPHDEIIRIGRAIADALDYAHRKGIVHRDVKPSNVMVAQDNRVVLTDFGLAMDAEMGSMGEVFGSAHYVSPEQARNSADAVPQSDLYSLGIILYEMLTGRVPFDDPSSTAVAIQHLTFPVPSPRAINPKLSKETEAVLLKALSKSPQDRYQTGRALLDALEKSLSFGDATVVSPLPQGLMTTVRSPIAATPPAKTRPLSFYVGVGIGAGMLILTLILVLMFMFFFDNAGDNTSEVVISTVIATTPAPQAAVLASPDTGATVEMTEVTGLEVQPEEQIEDQTEQTPTLTSTSPPPATLPTPSPTPTSLPEPQVLADSSSDFATGPSGEWVYTWSRPNTDIWSPLQYEQRRYGNCWYAEDYIRICPDSGHPGNGADIGWYWTSKVSGPIEVEISASKLDTGGDGVTILVYHNTLLTSQEDPIFQKSLAGGDKDGFIEKFQIDNISPEDSLLFVMRRNGNATSDHTAFHSKICHHHCPGTTN